MKNSIILLWGVLAISCQTKSPVYDVKSPNQKVQLTFWVVDGKPAYSVSFNGTKEIDTSFLSFEFKDQPLLGENLKVIETATASFSEIWEMPWGEQREVVNAYNELRVFLIEQSELQRSFLINFKVYDDGLGFRYEFPKQENLNDVIIMDENTEFNLTGNHKVWWIPGDWDIYEHLYNTTLFSEIDAISKRNHPNLAQTYIPENAVNTPVTMKTAKGTYISFHEADLTNYSDMTLKVDPVNNKMVSELVGYPEGHKVEVSTPFVTPWRTIQFGERAGDLIESKLIVNLNDPNEIEDISWFKPMKYVGIWWEMHMGKSTWAREGGKHGATTENAKKYIDFASKNGIEGLLVEGWNTGWEHWIGFEEREGVFDFVTPYSDYDLREVIRYGNEKGVKLIMHHETSAAPRTYDLQLDTAYRLMKSLGVHAVKTGYVGPIIPKDYRHHGQWMVNHYNKVIDQGVKYQVAINAHEPIKATGRRRTYPNEISREGLRGQEFNAWAIDGGNPPEHLTIVPFTRMLGGPIDFTPGIFNLRFEKEGNTTASSTHAQKNQINTTLAHQLALYVVIYSPIQMAADLVENYENQPAFQFIKDVAVDWEQTKVLAGEIGDFVVVARQERGKDDWFVGGVADENGKSIQLDFSYLPEGKSYVAKIYKDGPKAHWNLNPAAIVISETIITRADTLDLVMAPGGGFAISLLTN